MKLNLFALSLIILSFSCQNNQKIHQDFTNDILEEVIYHSNGETIEFSDLYYKLTNFIEEDETEKLLLVENLKIRGFEITHWGRGNHPPLSPRFVGVTMKKGNCQCDISKIYYKTLSDSLFERRESISCIRVKE